MRIKNILMGWMLLMVLIPNMTVYAEGPSPWARPEIEGAVSAGAMTDSLSTDHQGSVTRGQFVELMIKTYEAITDEVIDISTVKNPFEDTDEVYLLKGYTTGIVSGTSATTFSPDDLVTREQMVVMQVRMVNRVEERFDVKILEEASDYESFIDEGLIATWASESVALAVTNKLMSGIGDHRFDPKGNSTKEQAVIVNYRLLLKMIGINGINTPWRENLRDYDEKVEEMLARNLGDYEESDHKAFVTADILNMRSTPDLSSPSNIIRKLKAYEQVVILETVGQWYKIAATGEQIGYVHSDYIHRYSLNEDLDDIRMQIVAYAKQYVGTPYVYGGSDLVKGVDCSGFTSEVMRPFGYVLSRSSAGQGGNGIPIIRGELQPGDLVTFGYSGVISHVAIYAGNGEIVHATTNRGVMVTAIEGYLNKPIISYRRVIF